MELQSLISEMSERSLRSKSVGGKILLVETYKEGDPVTVAYCAARISMKWSVFREMYNGPCRS